MTAKWEMRPTSDECEGYNGYFVFKNGVQEIEVCGPRRDWLEASLRELIDAANRDHTFTPAQSAPQPRCPACASFNVSRNVNGWFDCHYCNKMGSAEEFAAQPPSAPVETEVRDQAHRDAISPSGGKFYNSVSRSSAGSEPVAWRWKWPLDRVWSVGLHHPGYAPDATVVIQPLYVAEPQESQLIAEVERLRRIASKQADLIDWLDRCPDTAPCDFKCGYGKDGDASACYCGRAEWEKTRPAFVDDITHRIDEDFTPASPMTRPQRAIASAPDASTPAQRPRE